MIKNLIIIAIILGTTAVSQQPTVKDWGQNTYSWVEKKTEPYTSKTVNWFEDKIYPVVGGEVEKRKDIIEQEIGSTVETQKEKISENLAEKLKNYFSNVIDSIFFPNKTKQPSSLLDSLNLKNSELSPELQKCIEKCQIPADQ